MLPRVRGFSDVDSEADLPGYVEYLDAMAAVEAVAAAKRRSYELLGVGRGDRVLDVGCGLGHDVCALREIVGPEGEAVGIDTSARLLELAARRCDARFEVASAESLPFGDEEFDGWRSDRLVLHLDRPLTVLREAARVLRPGGRIVISENIVGLLGDEPYPETAERARGILGSREEFIGDFLPALLIRAGMVDVDLHPSVAQITGAADVAASIDLPGAMQMMGEDAEAQAWRAALLAGADAGTRSVELRSLHYVARKPADQ